MNVKGKGAVGSRSCWRSPGAAQAGGKGFQGSPFTGPLKSPPGSDQGCGPRHTCQDEESRFCLRLIQCTLLRSLREARGEEKGLFDQCAEKPTAHTEGKGRKRALWWMNLTAAHSARFTIPIIAGAAERGDSDIVFHGHREDVFEDGGSIYDDL